MITVMITVINHPMLVIDHKGCDHVLQGCRVGSPPMRSRRSPAWVAGSTDQLATDDGSKAAVPVNWSGVPDQRREPVLDAEISRDASCRRGDDGSAPRSAAPASRMRGVPNRLRCFGVHQRLRLPALKGMLRWLRTRRQPRTNSRRPGDIVGSLHLQQEESANFVDRVEVSQQLWMEYDARSVLSRR
jgi:hypothetical protein